MCAITGWSVDANALPIIISSRVRRFAIRKRCLSLGWVCDIRSFYYNTALWIFRHCASKRGKLGGEWGTFDVALYSRD